MRVCTFFFCVVALLYGCRPVNRLDRHGHRTGRWITYYDSAQKVPSFVGRFRNGWAVGRSRYYYPDGTVSKTEWKLGKRMYTRLYDNRGVCHRKGVARIAVNDTVIRYYWQGRWKYYDAGGELEKFCYFDNGKLQRVKYIREAANPRLVRQLQVTDSLFHHRHGKMINRINAALYDNQKAEQLRRSLFEADSVLFQEIGKLIESGYPTKRQLQDAVAIPFYIISYAPAHFRGRYLDVFLEAAERGDLTQSTLAYFIDKLEVAKGEPQVYGTQRYYNEKKELVPYPVRDSTDLMRLRSEAGLN